MNLINHTENMTQVQHDSKLTIIILAAGKGTRMRSTLPKVLHKIAGRSMIEHVLTEATALHPATIITVIAPGMEIVQDALLSSWPLTFAVQKEALGTGDAVKSALPLLNPDSDVLVLYGDTPFVSYETLHALVATLRSEEKCGIALLGFHTPHPQAYGRLVVKGEHYIDRIVEYKDASAAEQAITFCNGGVMAIKAAVLRSCLPHITPANAKGEYYLTDLVAIANQQKWSTRFIEATETEVMGINARDELAHAEALFQKRLKQQAMEKGVTFYDPESVYVQADTSFEADITIHPHVVFGPNVSLKSQVEILPFSYIEGATVETGARIGPFARIRPTSHIHSQAHIGNFVEVKNSTIHKGAKINHLSYVGDADIGAESNIGAGTITCNYDGKRKHRTTIGQGVFVGSNSALIAPVTLGDYSLIGAGSVITDSVPAEALAVARAKQVTREGKASLLKGKKKF